MKIDVLVRTNGGAGDAEIVAEGWTVTRTEDGAVVETVRLLGLHEFVSPPRIGEWVYLNVRERKANPGWFRDTVKATRIAQVKRVMHMTQRWRPRLQIEVMWVRPAEEGS